MHDSRLDCVGIWQSREGTVGFVKDVLVICIVARPELCSLCQLVDAAASIANYIVYWIDMYERRTV